MKNFREYCAPVVCLSLLLTCSLASQETKPTFFPLEPGTSWVYEGTVRWSVAGSDRGASKKVQYKMEVKKLMQREGMKIAVLSGFPDDLNWSEGDTTPATTLMIQTKDGLFYHLSPDESKIGLKRLDNPSDKLAGIFIEDDLLFGDPLAVGQKFGDAESVARDDGMYCWVVESGEKKSFPGIKGIQPGKLLAFELAFRSNPDDMEIEFVPGIGIMEYSYHHHGTVAETELHLVEFHPASEP